MDNASVLALYDATMRANPPAEIGLTSQWAGPVLRRVGVRAFIEHWSFDAAVAEATVAAEAEHFRLRGLSLEWRVFGHDGPHNLEAVLAANGFTPEAPETFMALALDGLLDVGPVSPNVTVRRVRDVAGLNDVTSVRAAAFGQAHPALELELTARLEDPTLALFVAYIDEHPVASGRLEIPEGRPFASLYGGGVRPAFRGRGCYRALVAARVEEARRSGARYLTVDAAETSRPILQQMAFEALDTVRGWDLPL